MKKFFLLFVKISLFVLAACSSSQEQTPEKQENDVQTLLKISPQQQASIGIQLAKPQQRQLKQTLKVNGMVDAPPQNLIHISTFVGGFVKEMKVLQGSYVQKGQVLVVLEDLAYVQLQQEYLERKSQLSFALEEYKRQEILKEENINSLKNYQQAKANYETLQATVAATGEKLKMLGIDPERITSQSLKNTIQLLAPKRGFVTNVLVNTGKYVNPSDVLLEIVSQEGMHIELSVYEKDISFVREGQKLDYFLAYSPNVSRKATVVLINKKINDDRTIRVHCHPENHEEVLIFNTFVTAFIHISDKPVWCVPSRALLFSEDTHYVFVEKSPLSYELVAVDVGITEDDWTEIRTEALKDKTIVVEGAYELFSMLKGGGEEE